MRNYSRYSDPDSNPNFNRDWGNGRPRIRLRLERTKRRREEPGNWQLAGDIAMRLAARISAHLASIRRAMSQRFARYAALDFSIVERVAGFGLGSSDRRR